MAYGGMAILSLSLSRVRVTQGQWLSYVQEEEVTLTITANIHTSRIRSLQYIRGHVWSGSLDTTLLIWNPKVRASGSSLLLLRIEPTHVVHGMHTHRR